jgi:hypothetical protein
LANICLIAAMKLLSHLSYRNFSVNGLDGIFWRR